MSSSSRRQFAKAAGTAAAALTAAQYSRVKGANERIAVACIGVRGRGRSHISAFADSPDSEVAAVVDIDQAEAEKAAAFARSKQDGSPKEYADMRDVFDDKDIDAVSVATPNHWHALSTIWACQAGKDVYCEKPASHNIFEGRQMVEAARKYQRIVQVGQQSRTTEHKVKGIALLREGVIGKLYQAKGLCFKRRKSIGSMRPMAVPKGVEYDIWLGPAKEVPWKENRFHYNWHWYWAFGNGDIGNQGVHEMDVARWGLGKDYLPPEIYAAGGKFIYDDDQETPNTQQAIFNYDDVQLVFEVRGLLSGGEADLPLNRPNQHTIGNIFLGSDGYMTMDSSGFKTYLGEKKEPGPRMMASESDWRDDAHFQNFLDAVKSRQIEDLNCDVLEGHLSAALCHMANISYRTGERLAFDADSERFVDSDAANALLSRDYRDPYIVETGA